MAHYSSCYDVSIHLGDTRNPSVKMSEIVLNSASSDLLFFEGEVLNYGTWTIKLNTFSVMWPSVAVTGQGSLKISLQNKTNTKTSTAKQKTNWNYHSG